MGNSSRHRHHHSQVGEVRPRTSYKSDNRSEQVIRANKKRPCLHLGSKAALSLNLLDQIVTVSRCYRPKLRLEIQLIHTLNKTADIDDKRSSSVWKRMFHLYQYNQERFYQHYHQRSNVETVFSMIKRKFGERLRTKTHTAQVNEVLCKVLCHNLCCVIQSMYELGVEVDFGAE